MSVPERDAIRKAWHHLRMRNGWLLADDEEAFLDQIVRELAQMSSQKLAQPPLQRAIYQAYSVLLYNGLRTQNGQAAHELRRAFFRLSIKRGCHASEAEDIAQEAIARVLEKLWSLREPNKLLSWALLIRQTAQRDYRSQTKNESPPPNDVSEQTEQADPYDLPTDVEQGIVDSVLVEHLRKALPNWLERTVLLRIMLFGDQPRDVARDLELPLHRTRVAKSRAVQRLRGDETFLALLRTITDDSVHLQEFMTGAYEDES